MPAKQQSQSKFDSQYHRLPKKKDNQPLRESFLKQSLNPGNDLKDNEQQWKEALSEFKQ